MFFLLEQTDIPVAATKDLKLYRTNRVRVASLFFFIFLLLVSNVFNQLTCHIFLTSSQIDVIDCTLLLADYNYGHKFGIGGET